MLGLFCYTNSTSTSSSPRTAWLPKHQPQPPTLLLQKERLSLVKLKTSSRLTSRLCHLEHHSTTKSLTPYRPSTGINFTQGQSINLENQQSLIQDKCRSTNQEHILEWSIIKQLGAALGAKSHKNQTLTHKTPNAKSEIPLLLAYVQLSPRLLNCQYGASESIRQFLLLQGFLLLHSPPPRLLQIVSL